MQLRVGLALFLSLALISGAVWVRNDKTTKPIPALTVVENNTGVPQTNPNIDVTTANLNEVRDTKNSNKKLTTTDLIGRQLILDYVDLAASGQATKENIDALANMYVNNIPSLSQKSNVTAAEIKIVPNSKQSFRAYTDTLTKINKEHQLSISNSYNPGIALGAIDDNFKSLVEVISDSYLTAGLKLKNISVPASLTQVHLRLVNIYLENAEAMKSLTLTEADPATALAGLIAINGNLGKENAILLEIDRILKTNVQ